MKTEKVAPPKLIDAVRSQFADGSCNRREFLRTVTLLGVSAAAAYEMAGIPAAFAAAKASPVPIKAGGTIRIGMQVDDVSRPFAADSPQKSNLTRQVCEYLTQIGADNVTRPHLLEQWIPSEDLRSWTLKIRRGVRWHSGREFTADDVLWNLGFALDDSNGSSTVGLMRNYLVETYEDGSSATRLWDASAIEKVDDFTVRLNLKNPQLALPEFLFHYAFPMMDPEGKGIFGPGSVGTGPFELVEIEPRRKAVFRARADYWGDGPYLETLEFIDLGEDPNALIGALASKQIDGVYQLDSAQLGAVEALQGLNIFTVATGATGAIRGKLDTKPFDDARVRLALRLGLDQAQMLAIALHGMGAVGEHHHVSPIHPDYAELPPFTRNVERAKTLLAEAGYPDGLDLELQVPSQYGYLMRMSEVAVEQWGAIGVRVKLKPLPPAQYAEAWSKMPFGVVRWSHRPLGTMTLSLAYKTGAPFNDSGFSDPDFDTALIAAEGTVDIEQRRSHLETLEKIMQENGPIIQPIWQGNFTAMGNKVGGFKMHPTSFIFGSELHVAEG